MAAGEYPLKNSAILDTGTTIHIFNNLMRFQNFQHAQEGDGVHAGNTFVPILGYGEVDIELSGIPGNKVLRLKDVAFCEGFACNLVSYQQLKKQGYFWDLKPPNNCLRRVLTDDAVCYLREEYG